MLAVVGEGQADDGPRRVAADVAQVRQIPRVPQADGAVGQAGGHAVDRLAFGRRREAQRRDGLGRVHGADQGAVDGAQLQTRTFGELKRAGHIGQRPADGQLSHRMLDDVLLLLAGHELADERRPVQVPDDAAAVTAAADGHAEGGAQDDLVDGALVADQHRRRRRQLEVRTQRVEPEGEDADQSGAERHPDAVVVGRRGAQHHRVVGLALEQRPHRLVFADFDAHDAVSLAPQDQAGSDDASGPTPTKFNDFLKFFFIATWVAPRRGIF